MKLLQKNGKFKRNLSNLFPFPKEEVKKVFDWMPILMISKKHLATSKKIIVMSNK